MSPTRAADRTPEAFLPKIASYSHDAVSASGTDAVNSAYLNGEDFFVITAIQVSEDNGYKATLNIKDETTGYELGSAEFPIDNFSDSGPFILPQPWVIAPGTRLSSALTNLDTGNSATVRVALHGYLVRVLR